MPSGSTMAPAGLVDAIKRELVRTQKMGADYQAKAAAQAAVEWYGNQLVRPGKRHLDVIDDRKVLTINQ